MLENERWNVLTAGRTRIAVLGSTLWTDHRLLGGDRLSHARDRCERGMNDHRYIRRAGGAMRWTAVASEIVHAASRRWLTDALPAARANADAVIVVSHHAPSIRSIPEPRRDDLLATAYASNLEVLLKDADGPDLWAHGHDHQAVDYLVGRTRVVSAPRGRIGHEPAAAGWQPKIVSLEVP